MPPLSFAHSPSFYGKLRGTFRDGERTVTDMNEYPPARWRAVWEAIDARREELRMSLADLYRATGASEGTYRKMRLDGVGVARLNKRRRICDGLGWSSDSIEQVLDGGEPTVREAESDNGLLVLGPDTREILNMLATLATTDAELEARLSELARLHGELHEVDAELGRVLDDLLRRVERLEQGQPNGGRSSRRSRP
jgi:hypothetical protein